MSAPDDRLDNQAPLEKHHDGEAEVYEDYFSEIEKKEIFKELARLPKFEGEVDWDAFNDIVLWYTSLNKGRKITLMSPRDSRKMWNDFFKHVENAETKLFEMQRAVLRGPAMILKANDYQSILEFQIAAAQIKALKLKYDWTKKFEDGKRYGKSPKNIVYEKSIEIWKSFGGKESASSSISRGYDGPLIRFLDAIWRAVARAAKEEAPTPQAMRERLPKRKRQKAKARTRRQSTAVGA